MLKGHHRVYEGLGIRVRVYGCLSSNLKPFGCSVSGAFGMQAVWGGEVWLWAGET